MIKINNVCLKYTKEFYALFDVSLDVEKGEKVVLLGPENSGKTSLIRAIAGLESITSGEIYIRDITLKKVDFKNDISLGYVPAMPVFMPNKTVKQNLEFVLQNKGLNKYEIEQKITESLIKFSLSNQLNEKVKKLSLYEQYILSFIRLSFRKLDIILIDNIFDRLNELQKSEILDLIKAQYLTGDATMLLATTSNEIAEELKVKTIKFKLGSIER